MNSKKYYAYKEYKHDKRNVRENIEDLIKIGAITDVNGKKLQSVVMPITIVNGQGDSFGYIMELLDLKDYITLKKAWLTPGKYPTCFAICNIAKNFVTFLNRLHVKHGVCYKDVNEENIFFNPLNGDIKIIDNDNIGYPNKKTVMGTPGYMAPEIILGKNPDPHSDRFSFAVFMYRLLIGGFPFEGAYTEEYCRNRNILQNDPEARKVIFGTDAIFVWHPTDKRNTIEKFDESQYKWQAKYWKNLPDSLKRLFIDTFVTYLSEDSRAQRPTTLAWRDAFDELEKKLVECPHCHCKTFSDVEYCFGCFEKLQKANPKHSVKLKLISVGEAKREITLNVGDKKLGNEISKNLSNEPLLRIVSKANTGEIGMQNLSHNTFTIVKSNNDRLQCGPGQAVTLKEDMKIVIIHKTVQLNVTEVS